MADSKISLGIYMLCHRNYFASKGIKKGVYSISNSDIYKNAYIMNKQQYQSFHCKVCAFEIYHIQHKVSANVVCQIMP